MSVSVVFNGLTYVIPQTGEGFWGDNLTSFFTAIPLGALQKTGGLFTLTADVNFGANYGLLSKYFSTRTVLPSTTGIVRLAKTDGMGWRNNANSADLLLSIDGSDTLDFNGVPIGGAAVSVGALDSQAANANGLALVANVLTAQSADATHPGLVNNTNQSFSGQKTFTTGLTGTLTGAASLNVLTSALGTLSDAGTDGIVITGGIGSVVGNVSIAQHVADPSHNGYLLSSDWSMFASKQAAGSYITALTGDVTASGPGSAAATLATVNANVGTFASVTVNGKGLVTAAANLSGDISSSGAVTTIGANKVTLAMMAQISTATFLGRTTAATGNVEDLTATQATAILNALVGDSGSGGTKGLVPAPASGDAAASKFLKADGTWAVPAGAGSVTSVGITGPSIITWSNTPVTGAGTLTGVLANQNANLGLFGPASGSAAAPTFRNLASADFVVGVVHAQGTINIGLAATVAANALTINLKQNDGSTAPAAGAGAIQVAFRSATASTGAYSLISATAATSLVVPSGATLGQVSGLNQYVWVYALNNAGTIELAVSGVQLFDDYSIQSTTTIGAGSTSGSVLYSTTGRSNVPIRLIGRMLVNEATAGTWASGPLEVALASGKQPVTTTDEIAYTPTFTNLGTVTGIAITSGRVGDKLHIHGTFSVGTGAGAAAQMTLGYNGTSANVTSDANKLSGTQMVGFVTVNAGTAGSFTALCNPSQGFLNFGVQSVGTAGVGAQNGATFSTLQMSIDCWVPISGWSTYGP